MRFECPREDRIPQLRQLWKNAFGDTDEFLDLFFSTGFCPHRCRCVTVEGQVAAALYWFDIRWDGLPCAYLYAVATDPSFRGRGLCRALMADTAAHLRTAGYEGALLVPQNDGLFGMYGKMGYLPATNICETICAARAPAAIREIGVSEYAALRRPLLPRRSVVQEGDNLTFLSALARFYAGDGFLAAACLERDHLRILEYLGDPDAAGGLVAALGRTEATLRTPGPGKPFSMYLPLSDRCSPPEYFAFPFD